MQEIKVVRLKPELHLRDPVFIVGLPGVGHVGKLVAEHLIEELKGEKVIEIYSHHFPPQVLVDADSVISMVNNEMYVCATDQCDILVLVGDHQSTTAEGHYQLGDVYLDIAEEYGVRKLYTLGGFPTGQLTYSEEVLGAVNDQDLKGELQNAGVVFRENEPGGGIIGASGLLLGLGKFRNMEGACLMGLTSGYLVDPKSAQSLLKVICKLFSIEIDEGPLEERAKEMEKIVARLKEVEQQQQQQQQLAMPDTNTKDEDLRYIG